MMSMLSIRYTVMMLCLLGTAPLCISQDYGYRKAANTHDLTGVIKTIPIFIDTDDHCWTTAEKEFYYNELEKSQSWINEQAASYGRLIHWDNDHFEFGQDILYLNRYHRFSPRLMLQGTLEALGGWSVDDILDQHDVDIMEDKIKIIYFVMSRDRSLAVNFWSNKKIDIAVINCKTTYGMMTDHYTISHEILHQFGAWDLYYGMSQSREKANQIQQQYPYSIMINTHVHKDKLHIDALTASLVGWAATDKEKVEYFRPVWENRLSPKRNEASLSPPEEE